MKQYVILCLTADTSLRQALAENLSFLNDNFDVCFADNSDTAKGLTHNLHLKQKKVALLLCDDRDQHTIDFLIYLQKTSPGQSSSTILFTHNEHFNGLIDIVNAGQLSFCMTPGWQPHLLQQVVIKELTQFILSKPHNEWLTYAPVLDKRQINKAYLERQITQFRSGFNTAPHTLNDALLAEQVIDALYEFFNDNDETHACRTYSKGHVLTREGEPNHHLWFITKGEIALYKADKSGQQHEVIRHQSGSLIGGMSFVSGDASFSTGITLSQTQVIKLDRTLFNKVMNSRSDLLPLFTNLLLRHFNRRIKNAIRTEMRLQHTIKELEAASSQLIEKEKMAMLGQLVAGVAHELNNPVAAILRNSETLQETISSVTDSPLDQVNQQRGNDILRYAMTSRPISTADIRQRAKQIQTVADDRNVAKRIVKMGLDEEPKLSEWLIPQGKQLQTTLIEWEHYYQVGSFLRSISVCAKRIADMVKSLKSYARQDEENIQTTDIHEGIEDTLIIFENRLKHHKLIKNYAALPLVRCRPIALQQVWTNVIANALDAMPTHGEIRVTTALVSKDGQSNVQIEFADNGAGIAADVLNKVFELNFTTKREGNFGLGIGLSVCQQIVRQHGGGITMHSTVGEGTTVTITLPILKESEENNHE
ncbi:ATP-binding protein [Thaumasiovibrio sp. DFM-14]|uniref:ATP-binding protein n=1 Tax=Thaumasiovibrio sp. DFM-14 TaxID=3384792 RepID=UPI0039A3D55F